MKFRLLLIIYLSTSLIVFAKNKKIFTVTGINYDSKTRINTITIKKNVDSALDLNLDIQTAKVLYQQEEDNSRFQLSSQNVHIPASEKKYSFGLTLNLTEKDKIYTDNTFFKVHTRKILVIKDGNSYYAEKIPLGIKATVTAILSTYFIPEDKNIKRYLTASMNNPIILHNRLTVSKNKKSDSKGFHVRTYCMYQDFEYIESDKEYFFGNQPRLTIALNNNPCEKNRKGRKFMEIWDIDKPIFAETYNNIQGVAVGDQRARVIYRTPVGFDLGSDRNRYKTWNDEKINHEELNSFSKHKVYF